MTENLKSDLYGVVIGSCPLVRVVITGQRIIQRAGRITESIILSCHSSSLSKGPTGNTAYAPMAEALTS